MINIKTIDSKSMLVAFEMNQQMFLSGPPYKLETAKPIDSKYMELPTFLTFKNGEQYSLGMLQFQKIMANAVTQNIITKYAAGRAKNFTPDETRALLIKRLEDAINKSPFPDMVLHEIHALQMTSGFNQKERTRISMILKDADESIKTKIDKRLNATTLNYDEDIELYLNAIVHYSQSFSDPEQAQEALDRCLGAIAHISSRHKGKLPPELKTKMETIYSELSQEHERYMQENGEFKVKPWQFKYQLDEPGLRLNKK